MCNRFFCKGPYFYSTIVIAKDYSKNTNNLKVKLFFKTHNLYKIMIYITSYNSIKLIFISLELVQNCSPECKLHCTRWHFTEKELYY